MKRNKQSVTLVIAIMLMLIFALLGTTLLRMQATSFMSSLHGADSQRAFYLAESGAEWALKQVSNDTEYRDTRIHQLDYGEYEVTVRDANAGEEGNVVIESTGYIPSKLSYRSKRQVKINIAIATMDKAINIKNLLDWNDMDTSSWIDGDISAAHYEGNDADSILDEHEDVDIPNNGKRDIVANGAYPEIDMDYYKGIADKVVQTKETEISLVSGKNVTVNEANFFDGINKDEWALRNVSRPSRKSGAEASKWDDSNWSKITNVSSGTSATLGDDVGGDDWRSGDSVVLVRRYYDRKSGSRADYDGGWLEGQYLEYVQKRTGDIDGGDAIIDTSEGMVYFRHAGIVAEGDIITKGDNTLQMLRPVYIRIQWFPWPPTLVKKDEPCLATQYGDIISYAPLTGSEDYKMQKRTFVGLVYSQEGNVDFSYLDMNRILIFRVGGAVMGNNVFLRKRVKIRYSTWFVADVQGFNADIGLLLWQEE